MTPELGAAIVALLLAAANWIKNKTEIDKIKADRLETKSNRDAEFQRMHDEQIRMQCQLEQQDKNIKILFEQSVANSSAINDLSKQHAEVMVQLRNILDTLKEIKDKK